MYQEALLWWVSNDGKIRGPAGKEGVVCPITRQDIALFSAMVLQDVEAHHDKTYTLTGSEDLTMTQIAEIIGDVTSKSVEYIDETDQEARESRAGDKAPEWLLNGEFTCTNDFPRERRLNDITLQHGSLRIQR